LSGTGVGDPLVRVSHNNYTDRAADTQEAAALVGPYVRGVPWRWQAMLTDLAEVPSPASPPPACRPARPVALPNPFKPGELMDRPAKPAYSKVKVRAPKMLKDMAK
jgi:hypothetical protein